MYVRSLAEDGESHFDNNDLRPAYGVLKKLRYQSAFWMSAIRAADGCILLDKDGQKARWAEYFDEMYMADLSWGQLSVAGIQTAYVCSPAIGSAH